MTNDLPSAQTFNLLTFSGGGYTLNGGTLNLLAGISNSGANNTISAQIEANLPLVFSSDPLGTALNLSGGVNLNGYNIDFNGAGTFTVGQTVGTGDVNGDGVGDIIVSTNPIFTGNFNVAGGRLFLNTPSESEPVNVFGKGTLRGTCSSFSDIVISDKGDFHPCAGTTQCTPSVATLTCNAGTVESDCAVNNTSCSSVNVSGAVQINAGTTLKVDFQTQPTIGAIFNNLITAPGTISGCFSETAATPANVLLIAQCTSNTVSVIVKAIDDVFHNGFGG